MRTLHLSEPLLRDLVARYPFYEIARMYKCDARMVGALAAKYGLASAFVAKAGTEEEKVRIRELAAEGIPIKRIALAIGRSQDFVARRLKTMDEDDDDDWLEEAWSSEGWPRPDTTCAEALRGRRYDDVDEEILAREVPPNRLPLNGAALSSAARAANRSTSRSNADLCADA